jgi:ribonuclease D
MPARFIPSASMASGRETSAPRARLTATTRADDVGDIWRNAADADLDQPAGPLVNDEVLKWLARHRPKTMDDLRQAELKTALMQSHGQALLDALASDQHDPVPRRPASVRPPPAVLAREERLKAWRTQEAERRQLAEGRTISLQLVLPARAVEHLAVHGAGDLEAVPQLRRSRSERYSATVASL